MPRKRKQSKRRNAAAEWAWAASRGLHPKSIRRALALSMGHGAERAGSGSRKDALGSLARSNGVTVAELERALSITSREPRGAGAAHLRQGYGGQAQRLQAPAMFGGFAAASGVKAFGKQWWIIDNHGQRMVGPFGSQNTAQKELDKRLDLPFAAGGADVNQAARAALAALSQKKTYPADVAAAKKWLADAVSGQVSGQMSGYSQVHPATPPTGAMGSPVQDIPVGQIEGDPTQPRKDFDPALLKELSDSMATVGQIHPVLVRPHPDKPGAYMLVAGERRFRAAQKAGFKTLKAEIRELTPAQVADIQLAENEVRSKPKESETAKFVADRIRKGDPLEKIAKALGKSAQWVRGRQSMAGLAAFLLDLLDSGKLSTGVAAALGELPQEVQRSVWEAAALHSKTASGQEAYVRAVALREAGQDLFGQKIIEHVSGLTPKQRKKLIQGVERSLKCAHRLAANKGADVTAYASTQTNASETLEQVKELARALQRAARNVEKVRASRAVSRKQGRPDVMHKTQQHARKPGFWARIFG